MLPGELCGVAVRGDASAAAAQSFQEDASAEDIEGDRNSGPTRSMAVLPLPLFRLGWHLVCLTHIVLTP